jgi:hypothetical protein
MISSIDKKYFFTPPKSQIDNYLSYYVAKTKKKKQ